MCPLSFSVSHPASMDVWIPLTLGESFFTVHPAVPSLHGLVGLSLSFIASSTNERLLASRSKGGHTFERVFEKFGLNFLEKTRPCIHRHKFEEGTYSYLLSIMNAFLQEFSSFQSLQWANFFPHPTGLPVDLWTGSRVAFELVSEAGSSCLTECKREKETASDVA